MRVDLMVVLTNVAGILILFGFLSVGYSLSSRQTSEKQRPVYWLALGVAAALVVIYIDFVAGLLHVGFRFPEWGIRGAFVVVYILLGCLLNIMPWVGRAEFRERSVAVDRLRDRLVEHGYDDGGEDDGGD